MNIRHGTSGRLTALMAMLMALAVLACSGGGPAKVADTVLYNGRIVTLDSESSIASAIAVRDGRILAVGRDIEALEYAGEQTERFDLQGRMVVPGLIEGHAHPERASLSESGGPLPNPRTVKQCLGWIASQAEKKKPGEWIVHPKLFATRLAELRPPTLAELDSVAPENPVFLNGSYGGVINTAAMRASGITESTVHPGLLRDPETGRLNGKLRFTAFSLLRLPHDPEPSLTERAEALAGMFAMYNQVGFTSVVSGGLGKRDTLLYKYMRDNNMLSIRAFLNIYARFDYKDMTDSEALEQVRRMGAPTGTGDEWVRIGALKSTIDGGILTGTALLREPWGLKAREIFGVVDPGYRGIQRVTAEQFARFVRAGASLGWKMTAHCTGGGGVDLMLDAYEQVQQEIDLRPLRCTIIHGNFYTPEAISRAVSLNVIADMQPAWFYKDADAMLEILGPERIRTFHPYRSMLDAGMVVAAGSDHMVIRDPVESINPYDPWLAIWSMVSRRTESGRVVAPEEAITREEALRCYTAGNAWSTFEEHLKGTLEQGKLADMLVLDRDFLACPEQEIRRIRPLVTILDGEVVYRRPGFELKTD